MTYIRGRNTSCHHAELTNSPPPKSVPVPLKGTQLMFLDSEGDFDAGKLELLRVRRLRQQMPIHDPVRQRFLLDIIGKSS